MKPKNEAREIDSKLKSTLPNPEYKTVLKQTINKWRTSHTTNYKEENLENIDSLRM